MLIGTNGTETNVEPGIDRRASDGGLVDGRTAQQFEDDVPKVPARGALSEVSADQSILLERVITQTELENDVEVL